MKHLKLFFALFAMLALGVGNAWGATITINGSASGITTTDGNQTITVDGITFKGKFKQYSTTALWFTSGSGYIYNTTSLGTINSITINYKSGGSGSSKQYFTSGTSEITSYQSGTAQITTSTGGTAGTHSSFSGGFFNISISNKNLQATSIVIDYTPAGGQTPEPDPDPTPDPEPEPDPTPDPGTGGETTTVTYVFKDDPNCPANATDWFSGTIDQYTGWTATKGGSNNPKYYTTGTGLRVYNGGKFTITSTKVMLSITLTFASGSYTFSASNTTTPQTVTPNAKSYEWSVERTCRLQKIEITYAADAGGSETPATDLTDAQFAWSAATAEATMGASNTFPTLTNTLPVSVTYESSNTDAATIADDGTITLVAPGTTTISAKFAGGEIGSITYAAKTVTYALTVLKAPATPTSTVYVKVTSTAGITDGEYLIVYEDAEGNPKAPVAFDGSLETLDAASNNLEVVISSNTIAGTNYIDAATFTIDVTNGTILSASGKYIGKTANSNGLDVKTTAMTNTFAIDANGNAVITGNTAALRYNKAADQKRFRYYKDGGGTQEKIALYKKASSHTLTYGTCTNGSVSADVADGATVLSGTTITLSNTPTTDYKLSAYDVYKTGDETTKVTVTNGKFIMPEFDVTISATFELAKTLTGIEITTPATQTTFWQGETFNYTGLEVTAHFDGAADEVVTPTVTGSTATAGTQTVTVSYTEGTTTKTTTYTITVKAIPNTKETAYSVADAYDIIDKLGTASGVFISGIISQVDSYNSTYKSITYWISADGTTTNQLQAYSGKGLESADFTAVTDVAKGAQVIVCGNLKKHNTTYEFDYNNYLAAYTAPTKAEPGIAYATTEYTANVNEAFTAPTLTNPNGLTVAYSTSDATLATVDAATGAVTIGNKTGKVTITATFAGNETYLHGTASYNITISDPSISEATFVAGTDVSDEKSISKNGVTVEFTDGVFNRADNYRCYGNQKMTISYANGQITKIVFTCTGSGTSDHGPGKFTTESGYTYDAKVGTWVGSAKSVTFAASAQVRMTEITVYYKEDTRTAAGLAWNPETINLTVGDAFTAPTFSNPNSLNVNFESDNTTLATVSNTGVISLNAGAVGTATITATFAGNENYKEAEVKCTISVSPKTENVVILAQHAGKWYALKAEYVVEKTDRLVALPVDYINGTLYNVADADKALITWERVVIGNKATFKNGDNYLKGKSSTTLILEDETTGLYQWDYPSYTMVLEGSETVRTFLYNSTNNCFRNYDSANASDGIDVEKAYSALPVVTAPVYDTGTITQMDNLTPQMYGTICLENNVVGYEGITFYEVAGKEDNKVIFDEVTELVAGMPYIYIADSETATIVIGEEIALSASKHKSLQGTFTQIDPAESNILTGNYILYNNVIKMCGKNCGLKDHKAYFIADELGSLSAPQAQMPGRRRVSLNTTGENAATGIGDVVVPTEQATKVIINGQLIIIRDGEKYNVQGQKL